jgi:dephospho-CoA kinase
MDDLREKMSLGQANHTKFTSSDREETYELGDAILDNDLNRSQEN